MIDAKITTLENLIDLIMVYKQNKKKVVFANGCFDLLHVGHTRYLQDAKKIGDILVVGINSDKSIRKLKGKGRPIIKGTERLQIIASLAAVDYVFLFDDERVDTVLLKLKPDIHAKGTDYTEESVPERDTVLSYGGKIAIVGDLKSHSTRDIIKSIKDKFS
jgi:D-glycero-beta-D-manno-heptose 1-phosphate adenylyltransferase